MTETAEQLLVRVLESTEPDGHVANDLLREFFRGHPVSELQRLLTSRNENAVATGTFIAGELGARVVALQDILVRLARHPLPTVRCDVVGAIHGMKESAAPESVAVAIAGIVDQDAAVRWRTIRFLGFIGEELLRNAISHIADPDLRAAIPSLILPFTDFDAAKIVSELGAASPLRRRVALAAAIRLRQQSLEPLRFAASRSDEETQEFATEFLAELTRADQRLLDN